MELAGYPLIVIAGPTASGKSELAVWLARRLGGEIVNCDALQVYRGLDTGTAKAPAEIRREIPHHLLDVVEIDEFFSAGRFQKLARTALEEIRRRGRIPVLTGGTGFYLRTLRDGIFEGPERDPAFRERLERICRRRGAGVLHRLLARRDPRSAERIARLDYQRIARALEVFALTGRPMSEQFGGSEAPLAGFDWRGFYLNLPRELLYSRINRRVELMLAAGWLEEVRALLAAGVNPRAKGMEAIGYRQLVSHLQGAKTLEEAVAEIQMETRRYAKRQITWFRKESGLLPVTGDGGDPAVQQTVWQDLQEYFGRGKPFPRP